MSIANLPDFTDIEDLLNGIFLEGIRTPSIASITGVTGATGPDSVSFLSPIILPPGTTGSTGGYTISTSGAQIFKIAGYTGANFQLASGRLCIRKIGNWVDFAFTEFSANPITVANDHTPIYLWDAITNDKLVVPADYRPAGVNITFTCPVYNPASGTSRYPTLLGACTIDADTGIVSFGQAFQSGEMTNPGQVCGTTSITCGYSILGL